MSAGCTREERNGTADEELKRCELDQSDEEEEVMVTVTVVAMTGRG